MKNNLFYLVLLIVGGCVTDESPEGGIPVLNFDELVEGVDTLHIIGSSVYPLNSLILPKLEDPSAIGAKADLRFNALEIAFIDTVNRFSVFDSLVVEVTDDSKTLTLITLPVDSTTVENYYKINLIILRSPPPFSTLGFSKFKTQIRFYLRHSLLQPVIIRTWLRYNIGRVTGYAA